MELVYGANWMRTAIPNLSSLIAPLHELLESNYTSQKTRKKSQLINRPISAWRTSTKLPLYPSFRHLKSK